jgi:glycosyltransferase involved in cell wall biosynthesis
MTIALATDGIFPESVGGMQRHSKFLIEGLSALLDEGSSLHVLHPHEQQLFPDLANVVEHSLILEDEHSIYLIRCHQYSRLVHNTLLSIKPDVVYSQGLSVWSQIEVWSDRLIINPHGLEPYQALGLKNRLVAIPFKGVFNRLFRKAHKVVSLGGKLTHILGRQLDAGQITVLPNGVEPSNFPCRPAFVKSEVPRLLFLGRFASNKGIDLLLRTCDELAAKGARFHLDLIGKGPLFEPLRGEYEGRPWVTFHGFLPDEAIAEQYRKCDAFVLPTLFEGMPTVVLEAMASGAPIVVSDVGACAELVGAENGWLLPPGDAAALKSALTEVLEAGDLESKSSASFQRAQEFAWPSVSAATLRVLSGIAEAGIS